MKHEPIDIQLTVHYNNYNTVDGKNFIRDFDAVVRYMNTFFEMPLPRSYGAMVGFINHYGKESIEFFLTTFQMRRSG